MKTSEFLAQNPQLEEFALEHYGFAITNNRHVDCPICDKTKSFRLSYVKKFGRHSGICTCGSYTAIQLIERKSSLSIGDLLAEIDNLVGNTEYKKTVVTQSQTTAQRAIDKFKRGSTIRGTVAQEYLNSRGLYTMPKGGAVFINSEPFYDDTGEIVAHYPAIYCIASDPLGNPIYSHTTYLDGNKKASMGGKERKQRSLVEHIHEGQSCAIKLFEKSEVMAVGEGIESCLAFASIKKIPVHSCLNTSILSKYRVDDDVKHLYIVADNDYSGAGLAAAYRCATMNIRQRTNLERVTICWPKTKGTDFNDALINCDEIMEDFVCKKPK